MNYDYLDRLEADNVPETWHDQRPSHPNRPQYLNDAERERDDLWGVYDNIIMEEIYNTEMRVPDYGRIKRSLDNAEAASREYSQLYVIWQWRLGQELEVTNDGA